MRTALSLTAFVCLLVAAPAATLARQEAGPPEVTEGRLEAVDAAGRPTGSCPLKHTDVRADVSGFVARVTVTQRFANPFDAPIEAVYLFPLPNDAAVDGMTMKVGDRVIRGEIRTREEARAVYEKARAEGKTASLLEQQRPNVFRQSVANVLPGGEIEVEITYVETLAYEDGVYTFVFPMVVGQRYVPASGGAGAAAELSGPVAAGGRAGHDVSLELHVDAGVPVEGVASPLHQIDVERPSPNEAVVRLADRAEIPNRDFVLRYGVAGAKIEDAVLTHHDERGGFFTLVLQPPARVAAEDVTPKELVFVLDTSGSMGGFPIEKAKECIGLALDGLYPDDTFNLITFAGDTSILFPEPVRATPKNLAKAHAFLSSRSGGGGTEMMKAIRTALEPSDTQNHIRVVCFMTDGFVGNDMEIVGEVRKHPNTRVFSFGIGDSVNRLLLDGIAEEGRGEAEYVTLADDGSAAARRFHQRVRSPLLTDVAIDWGGLPVADVAPERIPDLFGAKPVVVTGRYTAPASGVVRLTGRQGGREVVREIRVDLPADAPEHDALATLWARRRVDELVRTDYAGVQNGTASDELKQGVVDLGLAYRLMTQFTSFVAVEDRVVADGAPKTVPVTTDAPSGVDYSVSYGATTETVSVTASALITTTQIQNLPLDGRALVGDTRCYTSPTTTVSAGAAASAVAAGAAVSSATGVSDEAVNPHPVASEFTAASGPAREDAIQVQTKAGGNEFHGSAYEFNRTSATASQPFAEKAVVGAQIPEGVFARNQFGFTLGGPVVRDRLFFFGAAEWLRVRSTRNAAFLVPTPELLAASSPATRELFAGYDLRPGIDARTVRAGDVFGATGAFAALSPALPAFVQRYVAVCGDTGAGVAQNTALATGRVDFRANDKVSLDVRYGADRSTSFPGAVSASPYAGFDTGARVANDRVEGTLTEVLASTAVVEGRFAFDRRSLVRDLGEMPIVPTLYAVGRPFATIGDGTAALAFPGYAPVVPGMGLPSGGARFDERFGGELAVIVGVHGLRIGGAWTRVFDDRRLGDFVLPAELLGGSVPDALDGLVRGRLLRTDGAVDPLAPRDRQVRFDETGLYVRDSWRVSPRLSLELGLRYDVFGVPRDTAPGRLATFVEGPGATEQERVASGHVALVDSAAGLYRADHDDWSPRVGVAWDVFGSGPTTIRGGYGIVRARVAELASSLSALDAPDYAAAQRFGGRVSLASPPLAGAPALVFGVDRDLRTPTIHYWSGMIERSFDNVAISAEVSGAKGVGLASVDDVNRPFSGARVLDLSPSAANPLARLDGDVASVWQVRGNGSSITNALALALETRRLASGLQLSARYVWAHAIDDVTTEGPVYGFSPGRLDPFDVRLDRGDADVDVRHRVDVRGSWELPFGGDVDGRRQRWLGGWALGWIADARTGLPFSVYDCSGAVTACARLAASGPIARTGSAEVSPLAADRATGDRYIFLDLSSATGVRGTGELGPYPSSMTARNFFRGSGSWNLDTSLSKTIRFNERVGLELRAEGFNIFNHANLFVSRAEADVSASPYVPAFYEGRRQVQFGAKLMF